MSRSKKTKNMILARRIRELRGEETQVSLAQRCGINQNMISRYERGTIPDADILKGIAAALGTTTDYLLGGPEIVTSLPRSTQDNEEDYFLFGQPIILPAAPPAPIDWQEFDESVNQLQSGHDPDILELQQIKATIPSDGWSTIMAVVRQIAGREKKHNEVHGMAIEELKGSNNDLEKSTEGDRPAAPNKEKRPAERSSNKNGTTESSEKELR